MLSRLPLELLGALDYDPGHVSRQSLERGRKSPEELFRWAWEPASVDGSRYEIANQNRRCCPIVVGLRTVRPEDDGLGTYCYILAVYVPVKKDDETHGKDDVEYLENFVKSCPHPGDRAQDHQRKCEFQDDPRQLRHVSKITRIVAN
jgi:hypothetical protein